MNYKLIKSNLTKLLKEEILVLPEYLITAPEVLTDKTIQAYHKN